MHCTPGLPNRQSRSVPAGPRGRGAAASSWLIAVVVLALQLPSLAVHAEPRVVLVGVDGASWNAIDPLLRDGRMPRLAALLAEGVHADLATVEPVISPVVWSSVATGRAPAAHGVLNFYADARTVAVPTVFERMAAQGLRVGVYDWLVSWPPQSLPGGFVIPGWLRRDERVHPTDVFARAGVAPYVYSNRDLSSRRAYFEASLAEAAEKPVRWRALTGSFELDAGALTFYLIDALSHRFWADTYPEGFDPEDLAGRGLEPEFQGAVVRGYRALDVALGEIADSLPEGATMLIASDHGFEAHDGFQRRWSFHWEAELAHAGLVPGREAFVLAGQFGFPVVRVEAGAFAPQEALLQRLVDFYQGASNEAGAALFNVVTLDAAPRPEGAERSFLERARQWAYRKLADWLFSARFEGDAHAYLVLIPEDEAWEAAWPDGAIQLGTRRVPATEVVYGDGFTGNHHPTGVFVAAGGAIRPVAERQSLSVLDVAPLFLHLAGAGLPDDLEGELREDWLAPDWHARHPLRRLRAEEIPRLARPTGPALGDEVLKERLRSMGYID